MIKVIIFDFDGVVHDSFDVLRTAQQYSIPGLTEDEYRDFYNGNIYRNKQITKEVADKFFEVQNRLYKDLVIEKDIKEELLLLARDYSLFIVSSNMESTIRDYCERNGVSEVFDEVLGFESHKSKIEKFQVLFDKYSLDKNEAIFVTDTLGDILEANKINLRTIAVDFGFHDQDRLKKGKPFQIVSSFQDIRQLVDRL